MSGKLGFYQTINLIFLHTVKKIVTKSQESCFQPSSTIQVIGANNAFFKHLKGKAPSPKYGVIFRHPLINTAPGWQRGKTARVLASKISLAARYDLYSGELKEELSRELMMKVDIW